MSARRRRNLAASGAPKTPETEVDTVKCDICDQDFANSMELEKHKEREHPMGPGDENLEKPDNMAQAPVVPGKNN